MAIIEAEEELRERAKLRARIGEFIIDLSPSVDHCPICDRRLNLLKTTFRDAKYSALGSFRLRQIYLYCPIHTYLPPSEEGGVRIRKYGPELPDHNRGKSPFGMDVVCFVGLEKFLYCKRREQIQVMGQERYGFSLSDGTVTDLGVDFLLRFAYYHKQHFHRLVEDIQDRGGYILGIDGTSDGVSEKLFIAMDIVRDWVLVSERLPSESSEFISPILRALNKQAGFPHAVVCDKGSGIERSLKVEMPESVKIRNCDYHFLKNVGTALMEDTYRLFQTAMVESGIQTYLKRLRRKLFLHAKAEGIDIATNAKLVRAKQIPMDAPSNHIILSETYDCISWILRYTEDNNGLRFPFSLPALNLYLRCKKGYAGVIESRKMAAADMKSPKYLRSLELKLRAFLSGSAIIESESGTRGKRMPIESLAQNLQAQYALFERLRTILDISKAKGDIPRDKLLIESNARLREMEEMLSAFREELRAVSGAGAQSREHVIVRYLDKYWPYIVMENLTITVDGEPYPLKIPRTSGGNDTCFGEIKSDIRKRIGKMDTGRELNRYGPLLGLVQNLKNKSYVKVMLGSLDQLPQKLSEIPKSVIDEEKRRYRSLVKNYDVTNSGLRSGSVSIDEITNGMRAYREYVEKKRLLDQFYPSASSGKASNGLLTV